MRLCKYYTYSCAAYLRRCVSVYIYYIYLSKTQIRVGIIMMKRAIDLGDEHPSRR